VHEFGHEQQKIAAAQTRFGAMDAPMESEPPLSHFV
jgi:hypothetical protein